MAAFTTNSMGAMTPYDSGPCSMTRGSDTLGSNMTALGVTNSTPPTTPWKSKRKVKNPHTKSVASCSSIIHQYQTVLSSPIKIQN
jgi:hypothetical protein